MVRKAWRGGSQDLVEGGGSYVYSAAPSVSTTRTSEKRKAAMTVKGQRGKMVRRDWLKPWRQFAQSLAMASPFRVATWCCLLHQICGSFAMTDLRRDASQAKTHHHITPKTTSSDTIDDAEAQAPAEFGQLMFVTTSLPRHH